MNDHFDACLGPETCICEAKRYGLITLVTTVLCAVEAAGGYWANSLAVISDAGHVFVDGAISASATAVALFARFHRGARAEKRLRLAGGYFAAGMLLAIAIGVFREAAQRIGEAPAVHSGAMLFFSFVGLFGNLIQHRLTHEGHSEGERLTAEGVRAHIRTDAIQSGAVIAGALLIAVTKEPAIDAVIGLGIAAWLALQASKLAVRTNRLTKNS